jgi:hypothetical protein
MWFIVAYNRLGEGKQLEKKCTKKVTRKTGHCIMKQTDNKTERVNKMETDTSMIFNVLVKREDDLYIAHCLELDIVATSDDKEKVTDDIIDLIQAQVSYAFSNDNLEYLYHPAPLEAWKEFYACKDQIEKKIAMKKVSPAKAHNRFIPPWFTARTCSSFGQLCHA